MLQFRAKRAIRGVLHASRAKGHSRQNLAAGAQAHTRLLQLLLGVVHFKKCIRSCGVFWEASDIAGFPYCDYLPLFLPWYLS